ncbi:uncharacterized protein LOC108858361 [Raphanus sativus]|uniref:Uncharacterized protein LOC108858361 n=1 Tax=Raphanus sativus TaxID=3726 RepID=A0A6J0NT07_RAPSA|nr:uncharacterized protein LOC108858361 [Raphanus sativus]
MKGYPLEDIYAALGETKIIDSMLLPTVDEEIMLVRIIDVEEEYEREGGLSDTWNYWLNVKGKKIWWKEMYELDIAARKFSKERKKGKGKVAEASSSNADLESTLKGFEEEILNSLAIGFAGFKVQVDTKLEAMDTRLSGMEKTQRYLKRKVRKIDKRLTSLESKGNEDGEYMDFDYGGSMNYDRPEKTGEKGAEEEAEDDGDKENSEKVAGDFEEEDEDDDIEQEAERRRVEADEAWRRLPPESDEDVEEDRDSEEVSEESPKTPHVEKEKEAEKGYEESLKAPRGRTKFVETATEQVEEAVDAEKIVEEAKNPTEEEAEQTEPEKKAADAETMVEKAENPTEKEAEQTEPEKKLRMLK